MPVCWASTRLPNPTMVVSPETNTALPVLFASGSMGSFLGEAVQDVNPVGDADADDEQRTS